jgi:D-alanyl-D-alanine carboxypeptidase/D-alanyl-D-alanine-endopeptidase (penicillin-binding protein 4)
MNQPPDVMRFARVNLALAVTLFSLWATAAQSADALATLRARLTKLVAEPRFAAAHWGVDIVSLDTGRTVFAHDASRPLVPASNAKLFTAALALERLGPDVRFRTSVYAATRPDADGTLAGDLILFGRGDPTLATPALRTLAARLAAAGVRRVRGDLIADESFFRGPTQGAGWEPADRLYFYAPEVSALTVNDNATVVWVKPDDHEGRPAKVTIQPLVSFLIVSNLTRTVAPGGPRVMTLARRPGDNRLRVGGRLAAGSGAQSQGISVPQPARWCGELFRGALRERGIEVAGTVRIVDAAARSAAPLDTSRLVELAAVVSPPLRDVLPRLLKPSQNLYAQLLLLQVGAGARLRPGNPPPPATDVDAGLRVLADFLGNLGVPVGTVRFEEGSGLSRHDTATAEAIVRVLWFMDRRPAAATFRDALPVAGVDGTLKERMVGTRAAGNVHAKTGSFAGVEALSGYVTSAAGERFAFALLFNDDHNGGVSRATVVDMDGIAVQLAGLKERTMPANAAGRP